jgi:uncharacterized protein (TIGR00156 family)
MKSKLNVIIFATFLFLANFSGWAQYSGPGSEIKRYTIEEVKSSAPKLDRSDALVKVQGYIVEKINYEDFWFEDTSGRIRIEIDDDVMPQQAFADKTLIVITGEVDYDFLGGSEIEVEVIEFVTEENHMGTGHPQK